MRPAFRGVSLAETIIACFVLTFAMLVSAALFHTALQHSVRIDRKQQAARIAEQRIEELRSWSRAHHGTNGDLEFKQGWNSFEGTVEDPENPGYKVKTTVDPYDLFSPSSEFEKIHFAALEDENIPDDSTQKRTLEDSAFLATIEVSWGKSPAEKIVTRTIFADPVRDHGWDPEDADKAISLEFKTTGSWGNLPPALIARNGEFRARAFVEDKEGETVDNAVITWYVDPDSTGNGTIISQPNKPDEARFVNKVTVGDSLEAYTGGWIRLVARVRLGGVEAFQKTAKIDLAD